MSVSSPNTEDLTRTEYVVELVQPNLDLTKPSSTLTTSKTDQALEVILSKVTDLAQGQSSLESRLTKSQSSLMQGTATILNQMSQRIESLEQRSLHSSRRTSRHTSRDTSREASPTTDPGPGTITSKVTEKPVVSSFCPPFVNSPSSEYLPYSALLVDSTESSYHGLRRSSRLLNKPKMDYYHLDRPGSWIGRRSLVTETPRTGGQQGPRTLLPLEQQVTLQGSAFDYVREEGFYRPSAQTSESEPDVRRNWGKKVGAKIHIGHDDWDSFLSMPEHSSNTGIERDNNVSDFRFGHREAENRNIRNTTETRQTDDGLRLTEAEVVVGSQNSLKLGINSGLNFGSDAGADMEMERNYAMSERCTARRLMPVIQEDREPMDTYTYPYRNLTSRSSASGSSSWVFPPGQASYASLNTGLLLNPPLNPPFNPPFNPPMQPSSAALIYEARPRMINPPSSNTYLPWQPREPASSVTSGSLVYPSAVVSRSTQTIFEDQQASAVVNSGGPSTSLSSASVTSSLSSSSQSTALSTLSSSVAQSSLSQESLLQALVSILSSSSSSAPVAVNPPSASEASSSLSSLPTAVAPPSSAIMPSSPLSLSSASVSSSTASSIASLPPSSNLPPPTSSASPSSSSSSSEAQQSAQQSSLSLNRKEKGSLSLPSFNGKS